MVSSKEVAETSEVSYADSNQPVGFNFSDQNSHPASPITTCGYLNSVP
jgi:hypothetical protein